ncbi:Cytochrome c biogenesis protein CcsA [Phycisphaerae bacterium RAS1]|nr:Cytochrome c biogenesis protein CcsA [Phycisphaerae bacterium RAS1]
MNTTFAFQNAKRKRARQAEATSRRTRASGALAGRSDTVGVVLRRAFAAVALIATIAVARADEPFAASHDAAAFEKQVDWSSVRLLAVQDGGRYKTLDSFARETISKMYGEESFPGLSPLATLMEWLFNRDAYIDTPVIKVKDMGLRIHFTAHMPEAARQRIRQTGLMTPREFNDATVQQRIDELEPKFAMNKAIGRVREAQAIAEMMDRFICLVPGAGRDPKDPWYPPTQLAANVAPLLGDKSVNADAVAQQVGGEVPGYGPEQALKAFMPWVALREAWQQRDAKRTNEKLAQLADVLPSLAAAGVYPSLDQRRAEFTYYKYGKFTWGYWFYMAGLIAGVWALVTRWRTPHVMSMLLLLAGMTVHAFGIGLRWYILGRIPVANMFEALVSSAWVGVALAFLCELIFRSRVFAIGAHATGFLSLILVSYILPGGGTITTIMGILDDVMLRIHTVLIISSYSLIFLASVIAVIYLFGYYFVTNPVRSTEAGLTVALGGVILLVASLPLVPSLAAYVVHAGSESAWTHQPWTFAVFGWIAALAAASLSLVPVVPRPLQSVTAVSLLSLIVVASTLAFLPRGFAVGLGWTMALGGFLWGVATALGVALRPSRAAESALAVSAVPAGGAAVLLRPILAGGAPGDERSRREMPSWLHHFDWSHLIILNLVFVMLFVGIILGAVWADYSWGRPWGWDPKEVFAMNTWIIYAILIHTRFVAKSRGVWTAWCSVIGCLMMVFNWCVVNFYIVGLHSYA